MEKTDLLVIGLGPAGLTAAIYAARYKLNFLLLGKELGGTMSLAANVCNYPGFLTISGFSLAQKIRDQIEDLGGRIIYEEIIKIKKDNNGFIAVSLLGKEYFAKSIILATGSQRKKLGVSGEEQFLGKGVSYCTTCDAAFFKEKIVAVAGGADAAVSGALHLANFASKVYLIYRRGALRAEPVWVDQIKKNPKIEVIYETNIREIISQDALLRSPAQIFSSSNRPDLIGTQGSLKNLADSPQSVGGLRLDRPYKNSEILVVDGVFIEIGGVPSSVLAKELGIKVDENGFIKVDQEMKTNVPGVFAAGDVTSLSSYFAQVIWACGQGGRAAASAYRFLQGKEAPKILGIK